MNRNRNRSRTHMAFGASMACIAWLVMAPVANAQEATEEPQAADEAGAAAEGDAIVVTGTRLNASFSAPTPMAVASSEDLKLSAPNNIADGLANLPQFAGNNKTNVGVPSVAIGTTGQNLLNLRGLGFNRNLVLLDGHRIVATNQVGSVDVNMLPQAIIKRVDTVTGGASAAYGSDAISGVVNFVLDRRFTGFKAEVQGGVSSRGDVPNFLANASWDDPFLVETVAGTPINQDQTDNLSGHESHGGPVQAAGGPFHIGQVVICISPSTTTKKGVPGAWRQQNGYTGNKCVTDWFQSTGIYAGAGAVWGSGTESSNGTYISVPDYTY